MAMRRMMSFLIELTAKPLAERGVRDVWDRF